MNHPAKTEPGQDTTAQNDNRRTKRTLLIVDDEAPVRDLLCDALAADNRHILEAATGNEAYEILCTQPVDLLVTDIVMPEQDGIALIMQLNEIAPRMPVIAISGGGGIQSGFDYLPVSKLVGANAILRKPFKLDELRQLVASLLE
jgi:CheY-like chemotaxis protein